MSSNATPPLIVKDRVGVQGERPNLLIHGDCLDALRVLREDPAYASDVRLAYLDPPFNTGERSATTRSRQRFAFSWTDYSVASLS